jgi:hypothetical protein
MGLRIEVLGVAHRRDGFNCGETALNEFLSHLAGQQQRRGLGKTYVALAEDGATIMGFVTVSAGQVVTAEFPSALKLPRYPQREARRDRRGHQKAPGGHRLRRDRLGQDHAAAEDLPRARARRQRPDRPHPAAPHRRPRHRHAHRPGTEERARRAVGFKIRFTDRVSPDSYIKLMTDGILLAETQGDPLLRQYDTLIIDEAHERSLNIDFLLGYLKQLLPKRPDLKVIVTSATLDAERFSKHFDAPAPVIEVSGRLYPIEMRWRPPAFAPDEDVDLPTTPSSTPSTNATATARATCWCSCPASARSARRPRRCASTTRPAPNAAAVRAPVGAGAAARLRAAKGRRVVLATNVAETSLTVPGIRYVVDRPGARQALFSHRNKVEHAAGRDIARSAANQRAGRCGRVMSGVCIRLYDEDDLQARPPTPSPRSCAPRWPA